MSSEGKCRECGKVIPADSPGGFCAQCLLGLGLGEAKGEEGTPPPVSGEEAEDINGPSLPPAKDAARMAPAEKAGDRIGRYRLLQEIGHGGCGVVYLAQQEKPVRQRVALKVIKLGIDTRQVVARFEAERQALALMDHPHIAKALDAGVTEAGRPYFVMELVGGIPITDFCELNQLNTRQRLDLFIQVCRAVQHAHQKGAIHRDIKPSNVLVATHDGVPVLKVTDFGIAKTTQGWPGDLTVFTAFEQFLGAPAYMSPEQAQPGGLDVDTRSDIYSLGVLLYELLTGKTPFDAQELLKSGLDEMRKIIREREPMRPSTRLRQTAGFKLARSELSTLNSQLSTDLDWIVMKCLKKEPAGRYETAAGLAADLERHLKHEPVLAGPPGKLYRLGKLVRRNQLAFAAGGLVAAALVMGIGVSAWLAVRATRAQREQARLRRQAETAQANEARERQKAQTEADKSRKVAQQLKEMLKIAGPAKARGMDTALLREILDETAARIAKELTNRPEVRLELGKVLANTYRELGLYSELEQIARRNWEIARFLNTGNQDEADALSLIGDALQHLGNYEQAEQFTRRALADYRQRFGETNRLVAKTLTDLATILASQGKYAEAEIAGTQAFEINRQVFAEWKQKLEVFCQTQTARLNAETSSKP